MQIIDKPRTVVLDMEELHTLCSFALLYVKSKDPDWVATGKLKSPVDLLKQIGYYIGWDDVLKEVLWQ